jgi:23S rRNA pseudouridine2604 synthase
MLYIIGELSFTVNEFVVDKYLILTLCDRLAIMSKRPEGKGRKISAPQPARNHIQKPAITQSPFPMRINKYLALKNYSTRRGADEIITAKKVFINGVIAVLGDKVNETDTVEVKYRGKTAPKFAYFAFNKPAGMMTNKDNSDNTTIKNGKKEEKVDVEDIITSLPKELESLKLFPIGRLDKESHGLIILTNDGRVTDRLLNPKFEHDKEYEVTTARPLRANFKEKIESGLNIEGYITKPAQAKQIAEKKFLLTLTEGKTHQVRRMVSALFNEVSDLKRTRIMNISLGNLASGTTRKIEGTELTDFLTGLGL